MFKRNMISLCIIILALFSISLSIQSDVIQFYGPGLQPQKIVMPARYFFVNVTTFDSISYTSDLSSKLAVEIVGDSTRKRSCRIWVSKLDRKDGTFIIRYKLYETCQNLNINIYYKSKHIKGSPIKIKGPILSDQCNCPEHNLETWLKNYGCLKHIDLINHQLKPFTKIDMKLLVPKIISNYHSPESSSFCHYVLKDNEVYRTCYGKHVGFNMFADSILLSLTRKVKLPNMELVINLGDWPLVSKKREVLPMFSWCGSDDTYDIIMPTYDITESTLENMGRVTLDILSVQGGVELPWSQRQPRAFWRGRDSRQERLKLVDIARSNPDLYNVTLTNFFFFRDKEEQYGPKQPHVSFFKFFDYKYQVNIDGTVAAYRLPYLLAGGGMVLKQDSPYYEHFYSQLKPWVHYVPVSRDLSDLTDRIKWARENDEAAQKIAENGRKFVNEYLMPEHIFCYHAVLFTEWSKRISNEIAISEGMTHVPQSSFDCDCKQPKSEHEEL